MRHTFTNNLSLVRRRLRATLLGHHTLRRATLHLKNTQQPAVAEEEARRQAEEARRQAEIEEELQLARDIQQGLLLEAVPHLPGWELSALSLPARSLGGDLYDFLRLADGRQGIMIGDVSGKGLPAALRMAVARTVFRFESRRGSEPGTTLAAVNRGVLSEIPQGMVTMLYATLDTHNGTLRIANAGHTYPLLINGSVSELELSGLPLGVDHDSDYEELTAHLAPGDTVLLYTDGVVEATSPDDEYYSFERLRELLEHNGRLKPRALVARLLSELRAWSNSTIQSDDVTMVVVRRRLEQLSDELRSIAEDVLGEERAANVWAEVQIAAVEPLEVIGPEQWVELLNRIGRPLQASLGRGLARELLQQLRLVIEEYRETGGA